MRILVDGRILATDRPTGPERSLRTLLFGFAALRGDHEVLVANAPPGECDDLGPRVVEAPRSGRLRAPRRADVLLSPVSAVPPLGPVPRVATVHDLPWRSSAPPERREWRQRMRLHLTRATAAAMVVPSESTREAILGIPGVCPPIRVVPPGLHPSAHEPTGEAARQRVTRLLADRPRPVILAVGANRPRKGLEVAVQAHAILRI